MGKEYEKGKKQAALEIIENICNDLDTSTTIWMKGGFNTFVEYLERKYNVHYEQTAKKK
jgi:hypothetical protein